MWKEMSTKAEVVVHMGCVSLAILYLTERKRDWNFVDKDVNGESNLCSTGHLKGIDLMLMLGLNEAKYPLPKTSSIGYYGNVLRREDGRSSGPHIYDEVKDESCFSTPALFILRSDVSENVVCPFNRNIHISFIGKH